MGWFDGNDATVTVALPAGGEPAAWSATIVRTFESGGTTTTTTSRFARQGDRSRLEWEEGGRRMALIVRPDLGVRWLVDVGDNTYSESRLDTTAADLETDEGTPLTAPQIEIAVAAGAPADGFVARRERIGEESVDGHACVVYRSRLEALDGTASEAKVWESLDFGGLALQSEVRSSDKSVVRTSLLDLTRYPAPTAFDLPPGARQAGQTP